MKFTICDVVFERGSFGRFPRVNGRPVSDIVFRDVLIAVLSMGV